MNKFFELSMRDNFNNYHYEQITLNFQFYKFIFSWQTADWGQCSVSCGEGIRIREAYCIEEVNNTKIKVRSCNI